MATFAALTLSLRLTWLRIWVNCGSRLSSTKFSHVMSRIHFFGFGSTAFMSSAAPPKAEVTSSKDGGPPNL